MDWARSGRQDVGTGQTRRPPVGSVHHDGTTDHCQQHTNITLTWPTTHGTGPMQTPSTGFRHPPLLASVYNILPPRTGLRHPPSNTGLRHPPSKHQFTTFSQLFTTFSQLSSVYDILPSSVGLRYPSLLASVYDILPPSVDLRHSPT